MSARSASRDVILSICFRTTDNPETIPRLTFGEASETSLVGGRSHLTLKHLPKSFSRTRRREVTNGLTLHPAVPREQGTFGTCGVGTVRGPGAKTADLSLLKYFHIK